MSDSERVPDDSAFLELLGDMQTDARCHRHYAGETVTTNWTMVTLVAHYREVFLLRQQLWDMACESNYHAMCADIQRRTIEDLIRIKEPTNE